MGRLFPKAVLAAAALHGALFAALSGRAPPAAPAPPAQADPIELVIEVLPDQPASGQGLAAGSLAPGPTEASAPEAPAEARPQPARPLAAVAVAPALAAPEAPALASAAPSAPGSAPSPFGEPGADGAARGRQAVAGLMGGTTWLLGGGGAAPAQVERHGAGPRQEDPDRGGKLLRESLDRGNTALGLGFGGPVAAAAHAASLSANAPTQGSVTFDVVTDAAGNVLSVTSSGGSGGDWSTVASALKAQLTGRRLRVPDGARGVAVSVRVEAKQQLPSGKDPGAGAVQMTSPISGQFDLADLSGRVARVVSARIVNERRL